MEAALDLLSFDDVNKLSNSEKKNFFSVVLMTGKFEYFTKFIVDRKNMIEFFDTIEILRILPVCIDVELFKLILNSYSFPQGKEFFYNFGFGNQDSAIRESIYEYFEDNHGDIMIDSMQQYERLLIQKKLVLL